MLHYTSKLKTYNIEATDGEMGKIKELYFDNNKWQIRYAVVDTRKWLPGRKVLLSPASFVMVNEVSENVEIEYDKEMVRNSPPLHEDTILTRDVEDSLFDYYGWGRNWAGEVLWSAEKIPLASFKNARQEDEPVYYNNTQDEINTLDLRTEEEMIGLKVHGTDGSIGEIVDLIFDDEVWKIRYLAVRSTHFIGPKYQVYRIDDINSIEWLEKGIYVNDTSETLDTNKIFDNKEEILNTIHS
ncbi:PRC-barrel domain containing protein [Oceanobacillus sp. 143]|uniref:PRC-barrel domain-containing protein n=1 Tax=Oceanobacillus zhaokaii TaxID=2052660 RepID=A0A345PF92_9BACI|nr:PRC-barrel domain-containing protein [Oceanobacillus zhaokaii]AXI08672.1 hypothetical protein CUC15_06990 [Oceanobacillus zhaokaii]QGS68435.1 PRC-barrel domain containing protein [Oceanobacillus sp. 143]